MAHRRVAAALAFAFALAAPLAAASTALSPAGFWAQRQEADRAAAAADWPRAAELYRRLAAQDGENPELWQLLAESELRRQRYPEALAAFTRVEELGFVFGARRSYEIAKAHARAGQREEALRWLERALANRFEHRPRLRRDPEWAGFADDPRFRALAGIPPAGLSREAGWSFDLDYFLAEARRLHADPRRPAFAPELEAAVEALRRRIPELDDDALALEIQRLAARLDDGHTYFYGTVDGAAVRLDLRDLPLRFYRFSDGLYVVDAAAPARELVGARVLRFGDRPADEVVAGLARFHGQDNPTTILWLGVETYLRSLAHLRALGAADAGGVTLTVAGADGAERSVRVEAGDFTLRRKLRPPAGLAEPPLWLRDVDANYWLRALPELDAIYAQINQIRDAEAGPTLEQFAATLRETLRAAGARHLIVDLRHNDGGNNYLTGHLLRALVAFEVEAADHRIWMISGRNTFSAAQNLLNRVERWTNVVVIGEPSASRPNFVGETTTVILPWSGLEGSISSRYWQDSNPGDERRWIAPHVPVALSSEDYFAGRDPVMEALATILRPESAEIQGSTSGPAR